MYVGETAVSMVCAPRIVGAVPGGREVPTGCPAARLQSGLDVGAGFLPGHRGLPVTPNRTPEPAGVGWGSWAAPRRVAADVALLEPVAQGSQKQAPRVQQTLRRPAGEASGAARSPGLPGKRAERRGGGRPRARLTLCVAQAGAQQRRRRARSFSFPVCEGKPFQLWALGLCSTERHLARRLKRNSFYPFTQVQPHVFALEYYRDSLWKGTLLFVVCFLLVSFNIVSQVQKQETWGLPACGMVVGLWLVVSSLPRRRLLLHCKRGYYHFSIQGHTVYQGPMHLIYVRLALSSDVHGKCFFQLVLSGYKLEPLVLVQLSERYELMEYLGRHIAQKLNINYFDCLALSYRHVVRHWPLSPYIGKREHKKEGLYSSVTDLDL